MNKSGNALEIITGQLKIAKSLCCLAGKQQGGYTIPRENLKSPPEKKINGSRK